MPRLDTYVPDVQTLNADDVPPSAIHAPEGYKPFDDTPDRQQSPTESSENTVVSPGTPEATPAEKVEESESCPSSCL